MKNQIDISGYQMMNENNTKFLIIFKWLLFLLALAYVFHFPDLMVHKIVWLVHTFYEGTSFLLEQFLTHTFGFDKFLAQLIAFYLSIIIGIGVTVLFWRQVFRMLYSLWDDLADRFYVFKYRLFYYWHSKRLDQKIKIILFHSGLTISVFMFLLM